MGDGVAKTWLITDEGVRALHINSLNHWAQDVCELPSASPHDALKLQRSALRQPRLKKRQLRPIRYCGFIMMAAGLLGYHWTEQYSRRS